MKTPFDTLLASLWQSQINIHERKAHLVELFLLVYGFSKVARVLYCNMSNASKEMLMNIDARHKNEGTRSLTLEEWNALNDGCHTEFCVTVQCRKARKPGSQVWTEFSIFSLYIFTKIRYGSARDV